MELLHALFPVVRGGDHQRDSGEDRLVVLEFIKCRKDSKKIYSFNRPRGKIIKHRNTAEGCSETSEYDI